MELYFQRGLLLILTVTIAGITMRCIYLFIKQSQYPATTGILLGMLHFVLTPLLYLGTTGEIPLDHYSREFSLSPIELNRDFWPAIVALSISALLAAIVYWLELLTASFFVSISHKHSVNVLSTRSISIPVTSDISALLYSLAFYTFLSYLNISFTGILEEGGHWYHSREAFMQQSGAKATLLICLNIGALITYLLASYRVAMSRQFPVLRLITLTVPICLLDTVFKGNRISLVWAGVLILLTIVQHKAIRSAVIITLIGIPAAWFFVLFRIIRGRVLSVRSIGDFMSLVQNGIQEDTETPSALIGICEAQDLICLVGIIRRLWPLSSNMFALNRATFLKPLLIFVPYTLVPDKPKTVGIVVGQEIYNSNTAWPPLLPGEAIINLWYFGIPIAAALVIFGIKLPCVLAIRDKNIVFAAVVLLAYSAFRFPFDNTVYFVCTTAFLFVIVKILSEGISSRFRYQ